MRGNKEHVTVPGFPSPENDATDMPDKSGQRPLQE